MTEPEPGIAGRIGHLLWGGVALLLLLALGGSVVLSGSAVADAEVQAERRAEELSSSVVVSDLSPDLVVRDITGTAFRDLTVAVQAGILSDDRMSVVRIWRIDGALIYSTAQRDEVSEVVARDDPALEQALDGETTSVLASVGVYHLGLKRPTEELFQTFVPIRLVADGPVDAVVQIDQRYGDIEAAALRGWRLFQVVVLVLVVGAVLLLGRSIRRMPVRPVGAIARSGEPALRRAEERARTAERVAHEAQTRLKVIEARQAVPSGATRAALEELELKLRASEAEREQHLGELDRLRAALAELEAESKLSKAGKGGARATTKKANKLVADAETKAAEAERKAEDAERRVEAAAKRATGSAERALEMEAELRLAEQRAEIAERLAEERAEIAERLAEEQALAAADQGGAKRRESAERKLAGELKRTEDERDQLLAKLEELERALAETQRKLETTSHELAVKNLEVTTSAGAAAAASALEERAVTAERQLADSEERVVDAQARLAEAETRLAHALARLEPLDGADGEVEGTPVRAAGPAGDLEARIAELEAARRNDVSELQRAQESFANTQVELANATRKLKQAEARIRELEGATAARDAAPANGEPQVDRGPSEVPVPAYVAAADYGLAVSEGDARVELTSFDDLGASERSRRTGSEPAPPVPEGDDAPVEGLSLRERLARSAAARRRGPLS